MPKRKNIKPSAEPTTTLPMNKYKVALLLFPVLLAIGVWLTINLQAPQPNMPSQEFKARQAYLDILGEPHTGLRLARLKDFTAHAPRNADTQRAKTGRDTLDLYEQNSWAHLTDLLYDIDATLDKKNLAIADYKANWGLWNRQVELPKLLTVTGLAEVQSAKYVAGQNTNTIDEKNLPNYSPYIRSSQYAKGRADTVLAGDVFTNTTEQISDISQSFRTGQNRPVRVKFSKRPRYPRNAFRKGISGQITLALDINERGHVVRTTVISAKAPRYKDKFIRAARRAAMASKFHPKTEAGKAVTTSRYVRKYKFTTGG